MGHGWSSPQLHAVLGCSAWRGFGSAIARTMCGSSTESSCKQSTVYSNHCGSDNCRPGFTNALAGLISTFVNIYGDQGGQLSVTAVSTIVVTGACLVVLAFLFLICHYWALSRVKAQHRREIQESGQTSGEIDEKHPSVVQAVMTNEHEFIRQNSHTLGTV
jgi:hypothetical protein